MHLVSTSAHGLSVDIRPTGQQTREVFVDDDLVCSASPAIVSISVVDQPAGTPATISGSTITVREVGRHLFKVDFSDGKSSHLHVMSMDLACLDRIPNEQQDRHLAARNRTEKCLILRSLATHAPGFDGHASSISFDRVGSLAQYGC